MDPHTDPAGLPSNASVAEHQAYEAGYRQGFHAGRDDMLTRIGELDRVWRPTAHRTEAQRIRDRLAEMTATRNRWWANRFPNRPPIDHPGGPVDWHTGQPVHPTPARTEGIAA